MKLIAKRGLFSGPDAKTENSIPQIELAISKGYEVEVDVRLIDDKYWLGHDKPQYLVEFDYLYSKRLWVHAKDKITYDSIRSHKFHPKVFLHEDEDYAQVSEARGFWNGKWRWQHGRLGKFVYENTINGWNKCGMYRDDFTLKNVFIDVDGVMCKTKTYDKDHNCISKEFCDLDFTAIKRMKAAGLNVVIVSGDWWNSGMADKRKIQFIKTDTLGQNSKLNSLNRWNYNLEQSAYIGDDWYDLELIKAVGYGFCPADACPDVLRHSERLPVSAGKGVIAAMYKNLINKGVINNVSPIEG